MAKLKKGMEDKNNFDFKLKLEKGYGCIRLIAVDKKGTIKNIVKVYDGGAVIICNDDLKRIK